MRKQPSSGQKWFLRPYFPLIRGMFVFRSCLRFFFRALEMPEPRVRKGHFSKIISESGLFLTLGSFGKNNRDCVVSFWHVQCNVTDGLQSKCRCKRYRNQVTVYLQGWAEVTLQLVLGDISSILCWWGGKTQHMMLSALYPMVNCNAITKHCTWLHDNA